MGRKISLRARCVTLLAVTLTVNKEVEVTTHEDKHASPAFRETGQEGVSFFRVVFTRHDIQHSSIQYGAWTAIQTEQESLGELRFKEDMYIYIYIYIHRVSQEERTKLRESVPYVKLYRYNPKHLYPKLNVYGDNGQRMVWTSCISA